MERFGWAPLSLCGENHTVKYFTQLSIHLYLSDLEIIFFLVVKRI